MGVTPPLVGVLRAIPFPLSNCGTCWIQVPLRQMRAWLPQQVGEGARCRLGDFVERGQKAEPGSRRPQPPAAPIQTRAFGNTDARRGPEAPGRGGRGMVDLKKGERVMGREELQRSLPLLPASPRPPPRAPSTAASRIAANCAPPLAAQGPRTGRRGPGAPAVITAAVAAARRVSLRAAAEINWRRQRGPGGGGARPEAERERCSDRQRGRN